MKNLPSNCGSCPIAANLPTGPNHKRCPLTLRIQEAEMPCYIVEKYRELTDITNAINRGKDNG